MQRREFITLLGGIPAADNPDAQALLAALLKGLRQLGWIDGHNVRIETRVSILANAFFNQEFVSCSRIGRGVSLGLLIGLFLYPIPAAAVVYPVRGVWVAIDTDFPAAANEACLAVKTFGVEAVSKKSITELIIFAKDKRYDVKGDVETKTTIKSIKAAGGGFRITETFSKHGRWLGFKRKTTYFLDVIDPQTIEIRDTTGMTRYTRCGSQRTPI
jgi:hypothetical protein